MYYYCLGCFIIISLKIIDWTNSSDIKVLIFGIKIFLIKRNTKRNKIKKLK